VPDQVDHRGVPPSNATLTSSFISPYFPLEGIEPDLANVPHVSSSSFGDRDEQDQEIPFNEAALMALDEDAVHTSFLIVLESGVRAYSNPSSLKSVAQLIKSIQPKDPEDILDSIQIDSTSEVLNFAKRNKIIGKTLDLSFKIPSAHFRFSGFTFLKPGNYPSEEHDQYDLRLNRLALCTRSKTKVQQTVGASNRAKTSVTIHFLLNAISLSAREFSDDFLDNHAAVQCQIEDIVFWLLSVDALSTNLQFKSLEISTASKKVEYLASLIHRTTRLVVELSMSFSTIQEEQQQRIQGFIYNL